ncbi:hypothetical protein H0H87_004444, partial [Tephrocybe sp. NHM501043]
ILRRPLPLHRPDQMAPAGPRLQQTLHQGPRDHQIPPRPDRHHRRPGRPRVEARPGKAQHRPRYPGLAGPVLHESHWDTVFDRTAYVPCL